MEYIKSPIMVIALLFLWLIAQVALRTLGRPVGLRNPFTWFIVIWIAQFALLSLPLIEYLTPTPSETLIYIFIANGASLFGILLAAFLRPVPRIQTDLSANARPFIILICLAITAQTFYSLDQYFSPAVQIASLLTEGQLGAVRSARLIEGLSTTSFLGSLLGPISMLASFGYISLGYYAFCRGMQLPWTRSNSASILTVGLAVLYAVDSLLIAAGRAALLYIPAVYLTSFAFGRSLYWHARLKKSWQLDKRWLFAGVISVLILFPASAWFQQLRNVERDPRIDMYFTEGAQPHPLIDELIEDNYFLGNNLLQLGYLTSSSNYLSFYLELETPPGPFYGRYSFPAISRNVGRFVGLDPDFWTADRDELFAPLERQGQLGNVWASVLRDFIGDFGHFGALIAMFVFGFTTQLALDAFRNRPEPYRAVLATFLLFIAFMSPLVSIFYVTQFSYCIPVLIVLAMSSSFFSKKTRKQEMTRHQNSGGRKRENIGIA